MHFACVVLPSTRPRPHRWSYCAASRPDQSHARWSRLGRCTLARTPCPLRTTATHRTHRPPRSMLSHNPRLCSPSSVAPSSGSAYCPDHERRCSRRTAAAWTRTRNRQGRRTQARGALAGAASEGRQRRAACWTRAAGSLHCRPVTRQSSRSRRQPRLPSPRSLHELWPR